MPLADTLLRLAAVGLFEPRWTQAILNEVSRTLVNKFNLSVDQAARRESALRKHFPGAWVEGHEGLIPAMSNDPGDRHVLAAAVHAQIGVIVTANSRHFPPQALAAHHVESLSPSGFLLRLYRAEPQSVLACLIDQANAIDVPIDYLLQRLAVNAPEFVSTAKIL